MMDNTVGENIKTMRKQNKMTQKQLADKLCIRRQTLCNYELGMRTPDVYTLLIIADIFEVSLDVLMGRNGYMGRL